ncbi:MAG: hypothetical protein PHO81_06310, partial [Candidatus Omnitrophica bacterium]|nr:hypothetical protein [Candidatus Omnitrophota bacterium]
MNKIFLITLSCICLLVYAPYLNNGFVFDDNALVVENPLVKSPYLLPDIFKTALYDHWLGAQPYDRMYRPLQLLSYRLDYDLWGLKPFGFHLSNILLHLFNSMLVFSLIWLLFKRRMLAASTSILFMAHPVQISSVAYVSARGDLLSAFFILCCCVMFAGFLVSGKPLAYLLSVAAALAAFLSRENAILIVFLLVLISLILEGKIRLKYLCPFIVMSLLYPVLRFFVLGASGLSMHGDYLGVTDRLVNFLNIVCRYALLLIWPHDLRMFHSTAIIKHLNYPVLLFGAAVFITALAALKRRAGRRLSPPVRFGLSWFLVCLLPVYFFFNAYPALGKALMAESWLYLPSIGFCLLFSCLCLLTRSGRIVILSCVLVFGLIVAANSVYWRNNVAFYERTLRFLPADNILLRNLAGAYIEAGDMTKAMAVISKLGKDYADSPVENMAYGQYYFAAGDPAEALKYYRRILKRNFFGNYSMSLCYAKLGDINKATE